MSDYTQTSINMTPAQIQQYAFLKERGYGDRTSVTRIAVDRMAQQEGMNMDTEFFIFHTTAGEFREARRYAKPKAIHGGYDTHSNWVTFSYPDGAIAGTLPVDGSGPAWPGDENAKHEGVGYRSRFTG